jgi:hypothetical protein
MNYGKAKKNRIIHASLTISHFIYQEYCQEDQYERQGKRQVKGDPI